MSPKLPNDSRGWRWRRPRAGYQTWPDHKCARPPTWRTAFCGPAGAGARWCRPSCLVRWLLGSGGAVIWPRTAQPARSPSRISWPAARAWRVRGDRPRADAPSGAAAAHGHRGRPGPLAVPGAALVLRRHPDRGGRPPFNEHLLSDIGGLSLAMAVVLGASAVLMERNLIRAALAGYTVYAVSHLLFHATHTSGLPATDAAALLTGLSLLPALALGLLALASQAGSPPGRISPPTPGGPASTPTDRDRRARSW